MSCAVCCRVLYVVCAACVGVGFGATWVFQSRGLGFFWTFLLLPSVYPYRGLGTGDWGLGIGPQKAVPGTGDNPGHSSTPGRWGPATLVGPGHRPRPQAPRPQAPRPLYGYREGREKEGPKKSQAPASENPGPGRPPPVAPRRRLIRSPVSPPPPPSRTIGGCRG